VRADAAFHRRLIRRIAEDRQRPVLARWGEALSRWPAGWKTAVPAAAMGLVLILALFRSPKENVSLGQVTPTSGASSSALVNNDRAPSLSVYRRALSRSFEELDALLDRPVVRRSEASEPITVAALGRTRIDWP
jgi:hypothetical protein